MKPTQDTNFGRVFELPAAYPEGFCFGGGKPVMMKMVDWFNPWPTAGFELADMTWPEVVDQLRPWLEEKCYVQPDRTYMMITDFGESMMFGSGCA